jgi:hypothetical protein
MLAEGAGEDRGHCQEAPPGAASLRMGWDAGPSPNPGARHTELDKRETHATPLAVAPHMPAVFPRGLEPPACASRSWTGRSHGAPVGAAARSPCPRRARISWRRSPPMPRVLRCPERALHIRGYTPGRRSTVPGCTTTSLGAIRTSSARARTKGSVGPAKSESLARELTLTAAQGRDALLAP